MRKRKENFEFLNCLKKTEVYDGIWSSSLKCFFGAEKSIAVISLFRIFIIKIPWQLLVWWTFKNWSDFIYLDWSVSALVLGKVATKAKTPPLSSLPDDPSPLPSFPLSPAVPHGGLTFFFWTTVPM